jgi:DNA polymerase delta subunit 1
MENENLNKYFRNKVKLDKKIKEPLRFQIISWQKFDKEINDDEFDLEYKIYALGVTDKDKSICVEINEFTPYFYVKIPDNLQKMWNEFKTDQVRLYIRKKLYKFRDSLIKVSVVQKKDIDGFTNEENFNFLKIIVKNEKTFTKCKYILSPGKGRPAVSIPDVSPRDINFKLYEANIEPFIRFCHIQNIKLSGWCEIEKFNEEDNSRCQIDISCKWKNINPIDITTPAKIYVLSFDIESYSDRGFKSQKNIFPDPNLETDIITQIGSTLHIYGTKVKEEYCFTINSKEDKYVEEQENIITIVSDTEKELLQKWIKFIRNLDPDIITGYNINNFDWEYIYKRCQFLDIESELQYLTRLYDYPATFKIERLVSNAYGENVFKFMNIPGLLNSDLYTIIKREKKLSSYKLDSVAAEFIGDQKDNICALDLFNMSQGTAKEIAIIVHYCVKDCTLVIDLILKLCIITNNIAMANVTWVPIEYIESKGQQIKVHSQLLYEARLNDYLVPTIPYKNVSEVENDEKFTGATVQEAEPGAHFEQIAGLDFASLYPSIMIANNYSYETIVKGPKYDNIDDVEYKDIIWTEDAGEPNEREERVRFSQNKKGILPIMLEKLWTERKAIKKEMKKIKAQLKEDITEEEKLSLNMLYDVKDGFQLAMKVSMNSIYGFTGANLGRLPEKRIAAATTAEGRRMIQACKEYVESEYNCKVVYGDTDSIYVKFFTEYEGQQHMNEVFRLSEVAAKGCSDLFKNPIDMEFEKVMWPFILFSKKRYACVVWTNEHKHDYIDYKGIQVVRRDNCPYVKDKSVKIFEKILLERDIPKAIEMGREYSSNLLDGKVSIKDLVISKSLKGYGSYEFDKQVSCKVCCKRWYYVEENKKKIYKIPMKENKSLEYNIEEFIKTPKYCHTCNKESEFTTNKANIPHVALARKMKERDPYNCPQVGERVPYVFKKIGNPRALQFERVEDPEYLTQNCIPIDFEYYFEHQFKSAIETIFYPILKEELDEKMFKDIVPEKPPKRTRAKKE